MLIGIIGFFAGIIGGMGMGGGTILIPALILFASIDPSIPMTIVALAIHIKKKNVDFDLVLPIVLFGIVGAFFGSTLAEYLPSELLRKFFGVFLLIIGIFEIQKGYMHKGKK